MVTKLRKAGRESFVNLSPLYSDVRLKIRGVRLFFCRELRLQRIHANAELSFLVPRATTLARQQRVHGFQCPTTAFRQEAVHKRHLAHQGRAKHVILLLLDIGEHDRHHQRPTSVPDLPMQQLRTHCLWLVSRWGTSSLVGRIGQAATKSSKSGHI